MEPLVAFVALATAMLRFPALPNVDPGPNPRCPTDMRLVSGTHHEDVQHVCLDPRKDVKDTHCFAYWPDATGLEGPTTTIDVCMDLFEAPNVRAAKPLVMKSYRQAVAWCGQRHKRPCTEQEWEFACEGPEHLPLSYGWEVQPRTCNSDKSWRKYDAEKLYAGDAASQAEVDRLWQGTPSGSHVACVSAFGIYDMNGNVEEWVTSRPSRKYPGSLMGGFWAKPWTGCRGTNDAHEPRFRFYETGFRCCADPKP